MNNQPATPNPDSNNPAGAQPGRRPTTSTPRWVKVAVIIFIALVLLVVILHITGNSLGGPGGHMPTIP